MKFLSNRFSDLIHGGEYQEASKISKFKINIQMNRLTCEYAIIQNDSDYYIALLLKGEVMYSHEVVPNQLSAELFDLFGISV